MELLKNQPIRLPGLSLDFARDGELIEPKPGVCSGLILSGAFHPDSIIGLAPSNVSMEGEGGVKPARDPRLE